MLKEFCLAAKQRCLLRVALAMVFAFPGLMLAAVQTLAPVNFNSQTIGTSSTSQTLTFTGLPAQVSVTAASGTDFVAVPSCNGSGTCNIAVTFAPKYPGLRQDAILIVNDTAGSVGQVVGVGPVYGLGEGPQIGISPGVITTVVNRAASALAGAVLNGGALGPGKAGYVSDKTTGSVYKINPSTGQVTLFAGSGTPGFSGFGGAATSAKLNTPSALAFDSQADLFIADTGNNVVEEVVAATGVINVIAGTGVAGNTGDGGAATSAELNGPQGLAVDAQGNVYISDTGNNRVREVLASDGTIVNFAGNANGTAGFSGDGSAATSAELDGPRGIAVDNGGSNLFIADSINEVIRNVSGGTINTIAGTPGSAGFSGDGGPATSAQFNSPEGLAVDAAGNLYVADNGNQVIRKGESAGTHTMSTIAGTPGTAGYAGDGGPATGAKLNGPLGFAMDAAGDLFVVDSGNFAIREITATPAPLTFSTTNTGPTTLTVANTGNSALTFSALSVTGDFTQSGGTCTSTTALAEGASCTIEITFVPPGSGVAPAGSLSLTTNSLNNSSSQVSVSLNESTGLRFIPITPCRVVDTRNTNDSFSGTFLTAGSTRSFAIPSSPNINSTNCPGVTIPTDALAFSLNVTVVPHQAPLTFLTVWQTGQAQPTASILNSPDGRIKANAAIIGADSTGSISVFATNPTDLVLDVDGYFVAAGAANYSSGLQFYPVTPCRVADTRAANGALGGPSLTLHGSRSFPILTSACAANIPAGAAAYSLNLTGISKGGPLIYLTGWPTGAAQPVASVLNAPTGAITANAAVIPAGTSGDVSVYASNAADVVIDINGYFATPGASGALSLYTVPACRVLDTRSSVPIAQAATLSVPVVSSSCGIPSVAQVYVFNATVIPSGPLAYITLWASGATPLESTLNADDGTIMSNMALVPAENGSVSAYASNSTNLILDIYGYWAP